jgi:low affinity Fe/Cu permease
MKVPHVMKLFSFQVASFLGCTPKMVVLGYILEILCPPVSQLHDAWHRVTTANSPWRQAGGLGAPQP